MSSSVHMPHPPLSTSLPLSRDLWFQREDAIQSTDLIELQATWAANVRYYKLHVLESVPIAMLVCRKAGEVYASNKLARELTGRTESEFEEVSSFS